MSKRFHVDRVLCTGTVLLYVLLGRFAKKPLGMYLIILSIFRVINFLPDIPAVMATLPAMELQCIALGVARPVSGFHFTRDGILY